VAGRTSCPGPRRANALGVWGNRDIGLCHRVEGRARDRYPAAALDCLAALRPRLVGQGRFSHVEPSVDPFDAQALRACAEGRPLDLAGRARRRFTAVGPRFVSVGH
jgi:hypothetical protein